MALAVSNRECCNIIACSHLVSQQSLPGNWLTGSSSICKLAVSFCICDVPTVTCQAFVWDCSDIGFSGGMWEHWRVRVWRFRECRHKKLIWVELVFISMYFMVLQFAHWGLHFAFQTLMWGEQAESNPLFTWLQTKGYSDWLSLFSALTLSPVLLPLPLPLSVFFLWRAHSF